MSEDRAEYKTEIEEALEMLGVGYDNNEPAVIIEKPRKDLALHENGLSEYKVWGWVKKSAKFIFHVRRLRGAKLSIWEVVSLSIDENGECELSLGDLVKLTGYSRSEVSESVKELEEMGYLSIQKDAGKKSIFKPSFAARGENYPSDEPIQKTDGLTHPVSKDSYPSSSSNINLQPSFNRVKRVNTKKQNIKGIEAAMVQDRPVTQEDLPQWENREKAACDAFESAFGIERPWNWHPAKGTQEKEWRDLRAYLVQLYEVDPKCFIGYAAWANDKYSRGAKNASQIRNDPGAFPTAWAAYKASAMNSGQKAKSSTRPVERDEHGVIVSW